MLFIDLWWQIDLAVEEDAIFAEQTRRQTHTGYFRTRMGAVVDAGTATAGAAVLKDGGGDAVLFAQRQRPLGAAGVLGGAVGAIRRQNPIPYDLAGLAGDGETAPMLGTIGESHPIFSQLPQLGQVKSAPVVAALLTAQAGADQILVPAHQKYRTKEMTLPNMDTSFTIMGSYSGFSGCRRM